MSKSLCVLPKKSLIQVKMPEISRLKLSLKLNNFVADFNEPTILNNDIGLVRLENDIAFTRFISPLCLPPPGETGFGTSAYGDGNNTVLDTTGLNIVGRNATVIGWGAINDGNLTRLKFLHGRIIKYDETVIG